jgi:hypothetical protein
MEGTKNRKNDGKNSSPLGKAPPTSGDPKI